VHADADVNSEYLPCSQATHVELDVAPVALEYVPMEQFVHVELDTDAEYLPAPHVVQFLFVVDVHDVLSYVPATQTPEHVVHDTGDPELAV
jgi:hypothetical protein